MSAFILVFAHRYFAVTDEDGNYSIGNVPPGTYTLVVWHETLPTVTRTVTVPESGDVGVDFSLVEKRTEQRRASPNEPVLPKRLAPPNLVEGERRRASEGG